MSVRENEHDSPEPERRAVRVPIQDVNQTEDEDVDDDPHITFNVCTSTEMVLQEESIAYATSQATRYEINKHGSEANKMGSSSEVGNSTATGETIAKPVEKLLWSFRIYNGLYFHCVFVFIALFVHLLRLVFLVLAVKILLMPDRHMMTVAFTIGLTVLDLKNYFAFELRVPSDIMQITLDGKRSHILLSTHS